ncbi:vitelline membrane outer layer protein 1 isoform X2 [Folsomia candida]|nr:vitelline membrane outer layer protein 1 isoform X2 [Folsomia candida]
MGFRLKTEPFQGPLDDTGLNGVQLLCGKVGESSRSIQSRRIQSLVGKWGSWGSSYECPRGYAVGFQIRSEAFEERNDNTAANNLRIYCSGTKGYLEGAGLQWGNWSNIQLCPWKSVICGLRTQVQSPQGHNSDDTSLNNVDMKCCEML